MNKLKNRDAFIDGGVLIALFGLAVTGIITYTELHDKPQQPVVTQTSGDVVFKPKSFKYYELQTGKTIEFPVKPKPPQKKECE